MEYLRPRDLLVRDLGYFATAVLQRIDQLGAFFLSRLHANATLYEKDGRSPFDLLDALRRQGRLDRRLRLGPAGLEVRVVAVPVPAAIAADRRGKARREAGRSQPSARRLALLNWEIFITNVPTSVWSPRQVVQIYGLRWRIEIVFKAWKSHLHLRVLPQTGSALEIQAMVCAKLIFITLFDVCFWRPLLLATCASKVPLASLLNLADLVAHALLTLVLEELEIRLRPLLHQQIQAHARHDKRRRQPLLALFQN